MKKTQQEMGQLWQKVMNSLWKELYQFDPSRNGEGGFTIKNKVDDIEIQGTWLIEAYMMNNEYIEVKICLDGIEQATIRYNDIVKPMAESSALHRLATVVKTIIE